MGRVLKMKLVRMTSDDTPETNETITEEPMDNVQSPEPTSEPTEDQT